MSQPAQTEEEEIQREAIKTEKVITHSMVNTETSDSLDRGIDKIMDIERYSNITTLLRVTVYVIRFLNTVRKRMRKESQGNLSNELTADELKNSETLWIKSVQANAFVDELSFLNQKNSKTMGTPPIRVAQFGLFLGEDQTIRCKGRISNAPLPAFSKSSILSPAKPAFLKLVIKQALRNQRYIESLEGGILGFAWTRNMKESHSSLCSLPQVPSITMQALTICRFTE